MCVQGKKVKDIIFFLFSRDRDILRERVNFSLSIQSKLRRVYNVTVTLTADINQY